MSQLAQLLFARPSFLSGVARILDFAGTLNEYNRSFSAEEADCRALAADWQAVGEDIEGALVRFEQEAKP